MERTLARRQLRESRHIVSFFLLAFPALFSIVNPLGAVLSLSKWFSTHPQTHERVARLMALAEQGSGRRAAPAALLREYAAIRSARG